MHSTHPNTAKTDHIGCLGNFNDQQAFCRKKCALSLRCIIASHQQAFWEQLESLFEYDDMGGTADHH